MPDLRMDYLVGFLEYRIDGSRILRPDFDPKESGRTAATLDSNGGIEQVLWTPAELLGYISFYGERRDDRQDANPIADEFIGYLKGIEGYHFTSDGRQIRRPSKFLNEAAPQSVAAEKGHDGWRIYPTPGEMQGFYVSRGRLPLPNSSGLQLKDVIKLHHNNTERNFRY